MAEGRYEEALKILKDGAKTNKRTLPPDAEMLEMLKSLHDEVQISLTVAHALLFTYALSDVACTLLKMSAVNMLTNIQLPYRMRKRRLQR
jgi:type IV secretory pathway VirD2 relaxase